MKQLRLLITLILICGSVCADPKVSYTLHCGGCHLPNGHGVPPQVPTLVDEIGRLIQIPGGRDYITRVPGASQAPISDGELANVLNFILNEFNAKTIGKNFLPMTEAEVTASRRNVLLDPLKYRLELWRHYDG